MQTVEIEQGSKNEASGRADVTVATYQVRFKADPSRLSKSLAQTLAHSDLSRLQKFDPNTYKLVIVDEVRPSPRSPCFS